MIRRHIGRVAGVVALAGAAVLVTTGTAQACAAWGIETVAGPNAAQAAVSVSTGPKFMLCDDE